jgi:lipoprotein-anchoring transpeptidase ErfK/SrfK
MRSKSFMAVTGFIVILLVLAGAMVVYDSGREDQIAEGVTVGGVDVGGLSRDDARRKLQSEVLARLQRPIVARFEKKKFNINPERAGVSVDIDASVDGAVAASREGTIFSRTFRGLTGGEVDEDVTVEVTYDQERIDKRIAQIGRKLDQPAVDADVDISVAGVETVEEQEGLRVSEGWLDRAVSRKLTSPVAKRHMRIRAKPVEPEVTTKELAAEYPSIIIVNRGAFHLQLYEDLKPTLDYTIAVGQVGLETPAGLYHIQNKAIDPSWTVPNSAWAGSLAGQVIPPGPSNPLKARWMGIYNGAGIHGTDATYSLGTAASHGCIRMAIPDVEELYDHVDVGTPVYIG